MDERVWTRSGPQKWEYKFVYLPHLINDIVSDETTFETVVKLYSNALNELGQEYWELVHSGQEQYDKKRTMEFLIFKRPFLIGESP